MATAVSTKPSGLQAVLLAGGLGTRLRSVVADRPKVLAEVNGRPFLAWILDELAAAGFERVCLATGYLGEQIEDAFGDRHVAAVDLPPLELRYSKEDRPLGTGGAVRKALEQLPSASTFVLNGDTYIRPDWVKMRSRHADHWAAMSIAVRHVDDVSRYGAVKVIDDRISSFGEKSEQGPGLINAGVYLIAPDLFERVPPQRDVFSMEQDVIAAHLPLLAPLAFVTDSAFLDIGVPADFHRAGTFLAGLRRPHQS